jgi:hypothetical protein
MRIEAIIIILQKLQKSVKTKYTTKPYEMVFSIYRIYH